MSNILPVNFLNQTELLAYQEWEESGQAALSPIAGAKFYNLFLNGTSCQDIVALNPGVTLGQIVQARLVMEWDRRRNEYIQDLLVKTEQRHKQVALETINVVSDLLSANNARFNQKLQKYLRSGRESDLEDLAMNMKQFKEMADLHHKLLSIQTERKSVVTGEVIHTHRTEPAEPANASELIEKLLKGEEN